MSHKFVALVLLVLTILVSTPACDTTQGDFFRTAAPNEKVIADAKLLYTLSSLVIIGQCVSTSIVTLDSVNNSIQISEIIAGYAISAKPVDCIGKQLEVGSSYLLFLKYDGDAGCNIMLGDSIHKINDSVVIWNDQNINLNTLLHELYVFSTVLTIPDTTYFYSKFSQLIHACDVIFIGEIVEMPELKSMTVKSRTGSTMLEFETNGSIIHIRALGFLKGDLRYNTIIRMVNIPDSVTSMTDATTLSTVSYSTNAVLSLELHDICMFFLKTGFDNKRDYYFPVNPIQSWIQIDRDFVTVALYNTPIYGYKTLPQLTSDIYNHLTEDSKKN